jgi:hypothetical protein
MKSMFQMAGGLHASNSSNLHQLNFPQSLQLCWLLRASFSSFLIQLAMVIGGHLDHQVLLVPGHPHMPANGEVHEGAASNNKFKEILAEADHGAGFLKVGKDGRLVLLELLELMSFQADSSVVS